MSLTRNEWLEMWASVRLIENLAHEISQNVYGGPIRQEAIKSKCNGIAILTDKIKKQIESVIGQRE